MGYGIFINTWTSNIAKYRDIVIFIAQSDWYFVQIRETYCVEKLRFYEIGVWPSQGLKQNLQLNIIESWHG